MILIIGGKGQGKLDFALSLGYTAEHVATALPTNRPVLYGLQELTRQNPDLTPAQLPCEVIICDEVGCGVVPVEPGQRAWREAVGRCCCALAKEAQRVERVFCGLPLVLKKEEN